MSKLILLLTLLILVVVPPAQAVPTTKANALTTVASWYDLGASENGGPIGCGTGRLDPYAIALAMRPDSGVPCGGVVVVCASICIEARRVDSGPYVSGRDIDLTYGAMKRLGLSSNQGIYTVRWFWKKKKGCSLPRWAGKPYRPLCKPQ